VTFVPAEQESKLYDQATATTYITVVPRPTAATIQALTASPTTYGQTVSLTIAVSSGLGAPGGTVTLLSNGVPVAAATLVSGQSSISVSSLDAGSHALTAQYSGSGGFAGSSSPAVVHTVNPASTSTALTSSLNPSRAGQAVTLTATVNTIAPGLGTPAGSVEFLRNGSVIGAGPLTGGTASLTISTLTSGKHAIQARYVGTGNHLPSISAVVQQSVKGGGK
jgi:large repetitive protein